MRILIVEDEHRIAAALKQGLEQEHYAVDLSYNGLEAYDFAVSEEYDLLILDLMLPGLDGLTLCRKLRDEHIHTPILMLTAKGQTIDKVNGLDAGADDYLTKPFSFDELLARVRAISRRPHQAVDNILQVEDLTLDTLSYQVSRHNQPIQLSQKEFTLLQYLMRNAGKVLSKEHLISHVWDYDADILPNTVEVYIRKLRQKIDLAYPSLPQLIHTSRGFGYRIGV